MATSMKLPDQEQQRKISGLEDAGKQYFSWKPNYADTIQRPSECYRDLSDGA
jgi:hypothetical protein